MNTLMYNHPLTAVHIKTVIEVLGYTVEGPIGKNLACGDVGMCNSGWADQRRSLTAFGLAGMGAMTEWTDIVKLVVEKWKIMLTLGP